MLAGSHMDIHKEDYLDGAVRRGPDGLETPSGVGDGGHDLLVDVQDRQWAAPVRRQVARHITTFRRPS